MNRISQFLLLFNAMAGGYAFQIGSYGATVYCALFAMFLCTGEIIDAIKGEPKS